MKLKLFVLSLTIAIASCGGRLPYRINIEQGNIVTEQSLALLKLGMSKNEVQHILGSSLLEDVFHQNRWDYIQRRKNGKNNAIQSSKISLFFKNDLLNNIKKSEFKNINTTKSKHLKTDSQEKQTEGK